VQIDTLRAPRAAAARSATTARLRDRRFDVIESRNDDRRRLIQSFESKRHAYRDAPVACGAGDRSRANGRAVPDEHADSH